MQGLKIEQNIDQRVEVSDGSLVAQFGPLNAQFDGAGVDPFGGGALVVDLFEGLTVPVELMAEPSAGRKDQRRGTTAL